MPSVTTGNIMCMERTTKTESYTATSLDQIIGCNTTAAGFTITLPLANTFIKGQFISIKDEAGVASTNNITVNTSNGEFIDGAEDIIIIINYGSVSIYSDGVETWYIFDIDNSPLSNILSLSELEDISTTTIIPVISTSGVYKKISAVNLTNEYIRKSKHSITTVSTTQTLSLSNAFSLNIIIVSIPGLTLTLNLPTNPVESQVFQFTTLTNTVTLVVGDKDGNDITPTFAGAPTAGFSVSYVYHNSESATWYKISS